MLTGWKLKPAQATKSAGFNMSNPIPYRINEDQSDMRGVKEGWYAVDEEGKLTLGPFSSRYDCLSRLRTAARPPK
jgi:hypothetical protein